MVINVNYINIVYYRKSFKTLFLHPQLAFFDDNLGTEVKNLMKYISKCHKMIANCKYSLWKYIVAENCFIGNKLYKKQQKLKPLEFVITRKE